MQTTGIVAGSLDPVTRGHEWLMAEAARLVDSLHIVIGANPAKKHFFTGPTRKRLVHTVLVDMDMANTPTQVHLLEKSILLIDFAAQVGATHLIRGIRNAQDLAYETNLALVNRKLNPAIRTVFVPTPPDLTEVSSSVVQGLVGYDGWEENIAGYVHPAVVEAFREHLAGKG